MDSAEHRRCMRLLHLAQEGDDNAHQELVGTVAYHFRWMLVRFYCSDPAFGDEDLYGRFMEGIWHAVDKVDGRGDPLFHLAKRGEWAVSAYVAVIHRRRCGAEGQISVGSLPLGWDVPDTNTDSSPEFVLELAVDRDEAQQAVMRVRAHLKLKPYEQRALDWMLQDPDPFELGANIRLADFLGVSPQRASVVRRQTLSKIRDSAGD